MEAPTIVILGESSDKSTDLVCQWLHHWNVPFLRLNEENEVNPVVGIEYENEGINVFVYKDGVRYHLSESQKTWFRRGYFLFRYVDDIPALGEETNRSIKKHLANEGKTLERFLYYHLGKNIAINHPDNYNYNKLIALREAQNAGLKIPPTLLSVHPDAIREFLNSQGNCISKSIQDMMGIETDGHYAFSGKTVRVDKESICPKGQWYSLFQREIKKKYELRIFFFMGRMYTMAIFSQMDKESELDFRAVDVNGKHPNRMVPFTLPSETARKIRRLMKRLQLESGSIDIIVDQNNDYYFLEVNPVGQFNFVSEICNYHIEKDIAKYLAQ